MDLPSVLFMSGRTGLEEQAPFPDNSKNST
jgi:hypothetical protein